MNSDRRRRADGLMRLALIAAPPERRPWAEAMRAEAAHLPDDCAEAFAWGCLWATVRARAGSPAFLLRTTRRVLVLGAIGVGALSLALGLRLSGAGAAAPATVAYAGAALYAAGALLTARFGLRAATLLATPSLVPAGVIAAGAGMLLPPSPYNDLYRALALEQCVLLATVLLIAGGVPRWAAAREGTRHGR